jgi:hypothetical protein
MLALPDELQQFKQRQQEEAKRAQEAQETRRARQRKHKTARMVFVEGAGPAMMAPQIMPGETYPLIPRIGCDFEWHPPETEVATVSEEDWAFADGTGDMEWLND